MEYEDYTPISKKLFENTEYLKKKLGVDESFDVGVRDLIIGDRKVHLFYVTGLTNVEYVIELIQSLVRLNDVEKVSGKEAYSIIYNRVVHQQVEEVEDLEVFSVDVLSGLLGILIDGETKGLIVDVRSYPGRQPAEPDTEKVVRGSRDGFTENIIINTALTRRRIRDGNLRHEIFKVGKKSKTDVCITYIKGKADEKVVNDIRDRIQKIDVNELTMSDKKLETLILNQGINPFPKVRYTERPDTLAIHLYHGKIGIIVDTSPSVIIAPTTYFDQLQHAEEYRQTKVAGSFLRFSRVLGVVGSIFLVPLWILVVKQPDLLPENLRYIGPDDPGNVPIIFQVLLGEFGLEILRMAAIHTPTPLSTAMGIVAGILVGQIAIDVGLFTPEVVLYVAISQLGTFATPSYELSIANKIVKIVMIICTWFFGLWGFVGSFAFFTLGLAFTKSFNQPYLYPLLPFNLKGFLNIFLRVYDGNTDQKKSKK
ncbi:spore germination protein [Haloplasma contractile]|uniref:Stage V sporulation protein AF n=1 Tax=Haloplasma contractile SSD-17B TaxID=1033810 RepID=F7PVL8_9MOLU|nr:spore germination protein [Haloplasma contractile]ERJ12816.1 Stage V sporulation protein AF [Haloplasma contractile SSD-17B]